MSHETTERQAFIDAYLTEHYPKGVSLTKMADHLRACRNTLSRRVKELGIPRCGTVGSTPYPAEHREFMLRNANVLPLAEIAAHVGRSEKQVFGWLKSQRKHIPAPTSDDLDDHAHIAAQMEAIDRKRIEEGYLPKFRKATEAELAAIKRAKARRPRSLNLPAERYDLSLKR